uniref:Uncharacterized protein n=1 Tax=Auxenochlorella protothecoides TaxID=3075 RepID=A0A1D1ZU36_AUXPR
MHTLCPESFLLVMNPNPVITPPTPSHPHTPLPGRTQEQLRAAARVAFAVLYQVDLSRLEPGSRVALHLAAALGALQREADLLDPGQRDVLAAVMADAGVEGTASPAAVPGLGPRLPVPTLAPDPEGVEALARTLFVPGKVFQDWRWDDILEA